MRNVTRTALAAVATGALVVAPAASAKKHSTHRTRVVKPGESIQAAIDKSKPGDTVLVKKGTYKENLQISTNRVWLRGQSGAVLTQPAKPTSNTCTAASESGKSPGICIVGDVTPAPGGDGPPTVNSTVDNVKVTGFTVKGFDGDGIFIFAAQSTKVLHTRSLSNGGYGAFANTSSGTHFVKDASRHNGDAGFYVGDSPHADAVLKGNKSTDNVFGIFLRDAEHGHVKGNTLSGNCAGVLVLADAPGPAGFFTIERNKVSRNNKACNDQGGPVSGLGIGLSGAHDTKVLKNKVTGNKDIHESGASGGIVVRKGDGGTEPANDLVKGNKLSSNSPFDIDWDGTGSVTFKSNSCSTSQPSGLCS